ncbi:hypothetical protein AAG570_013100 [Ranatra chinensis]|uniref:Uncharacterized protein n=1 Tax=Ranatra chinensis TaxID=642074 RepID=A0ABD0YUD7_9HEMI
MASKRRNMFHKNKTQETTEEDVLEEVLERPPRSDETVCSSPSSDWTLSSLVSEKFENLGEESKNSTNTPNQNSGNVIEFDDVANNKNNISSLVGHTIKELKQQGLSDQVRHNFENSIHDLHLKTVISKSAAKKFHCTNGDTFSNSYFDCKEDEALQRPNIHYESDAFFEGNTNGNLEDDLGGKSEKLSSSGEYSVGWQVQLLNKVISPTFSKGGNFQTSFETESNEVKDAESSTPFTISERNLLEKEMSTLFDVTKEIWHCRTVNEDYYFCSHKCHQLFRMHPNRFSRYQYPVNPPVLRICLVSTPGTGSELLARKIACELDLEYYDLEEIINDNLLPPGCLPVGMVNEHSSSAFDYYPPEIDQDLAVERLQHIRSYLACEENLPSELMDILMKPFRESKKGFIYHRFPHMTNDIEYMIKMEFYPDLIISRKIPKVFDLKWQVLVLSMVGQYSPVKGKFETTIFQNCCWFESIIWYKFSYQHICSGCLLVCDIRYQVMPCQYGSHDTNTAISTATVSTSGTSFTTVHNPLASSPRSTTPSSASATARASPIHEAECARCQEYQHTKGYCNRPPRCDRCGGGGWQVNLGMPENQGNAGDLFPSARETIPPTTRVARSIKSCKRGADLASRGGMCRLDGRGPWRRFAL